MEKKELSTKKSKKIKGAQPLPWWCSGQGCGAQSLMNEYRFLRWVPSPLNNLIKVSWLNSERKGLGKTEKSRWCSGGVVVLEA